MARTTVCIPRPVALKVDSWAESQGLPSGPGHRTRALVELVERGLRKPEGGAE